MGDLTQKPLDANEIETRFIFHPATNETGPQHEKIRGMLEVVATEICAITPKSREQSLAVTALEEAMFWSNAAIARRTPAEER